jgi:hypothetical protein
MIPVPMIIVVDIATRCSELRIEWIKHENTLNLRLLDEFGSHCL